MGKHRRLVTGVNDVGRHVFVSEEQLDSFSFMAGSELFDVWTSDQVATVPNDGVQDPGPSYWPPVGGYRFFVFTIFPEGQSQDQTLDQLAQVRPGWLDMLDVHSDSEPGMHASNTLDFAVVLSGEIELELDDGAVRILAAGDSVIQNGTRHRWNNPGDVPSTVAVILLGAEHR